MNARALTSSVGATLLALGLLGLPAGDRVRAADDKEAAPAPEAARFFETKVKPVLTQNCAKCHGEAKQRGGLRLDSRAGLLTGGDQGAALLPGDPAKSLLIQAITYEHGELKMPPSKKLPAQQIEDLAAWVKMGAPWPGAEKAPAPTRRAEMQVTDKDRAHWAFRPVHRPAPPAVKNPAWARNPIDAFILARLEAKGLHPNPPADRRELVRRVTFDLTGLPPTPAEVEAFVSDPAPRAYERLIDRLLESPRYGEKWGRHWLDLVRFAETNSYERDNPKPNAWRYRDYVIRAFNADKPYDQFVREQLAGDELPGAGSDGLIATGYYRLGIWDDEPTDPVLAKFDGLDDIVATTGQVFLGLTVDCARCHDHKIDPIPQKDYYRLLSFFHNINHYRNGGPTDEAQLFADAASRERYERQVRDLEQKRNDVQADLSKIEAEFRQKYAAAAASQPDLDDLQYRFYRDSWDKLPDFAALKHEDAGKLPRQLFDLSPRTRDEAFGFVFEGVLLVPEAGQYTFYLDSDDGSRLTVAGKKVLVHDGIHVVGNEQKATVELARGRLPIKLEYFQNGAGLGLSVAWSGPKFERRTLSAVDRPKGAGRRRQQDLAAQIAGEGARVLGRETAQRYQRLQRELQRLKQERVPADRALVVSEAGVSPPDTFVQVRGNPHVKGDKVEPAFPVVLSAPAPRLPAPGARSSGRRLALANWIASADNQLTARVMANRVWQFHFGRGIVRSASNFGTQGDAPTHPELLDWLASEFVAGGWRLKALHRLILTSSAYQMSSRGNPAAYAVDPVNDLFWRFDMRRLSAEEVRDSVLSVCGNLNLKMFGPGIYTEIPAEVLAGQSKPGYGWGRSSPEEQGRRSVYVHQKRSLLTPIVESFDAADVDRSCPVRFATTQPTQALGLLNGDFAHAQAELFARRLVSEAGEDVGRQVALGLQLATSRPATDDEVRRGVRLIEALRKEDGASPELARRLFCLMALNLNEMVYLD